MSPLQIPIAPNGFANGYLPNLVLASGHVAYFPAHFP